MGGQEWGICSSLWRIEWGEGCPDVLYLPPALKSKGLESLGNWLVQAPDALTIIGGDLNLTMCAQADRLSTVSQTGQGILG